MENLLISSHEVISSINSTGLSSQGTAGNLGNAITTENGQETLAGTIAIDRSSPVSSPNLSPRPSPRAYNRREYTRFNSDSAARELLRVNKSEDQLSQVHVSMINSCRKYLQGKGGREVDEKMYNCSGN